MYDPATVAISGAFGNQNESEKRNGTEKLTKQILITGSEGLIGRVVRRKLQSQGVKVRGLDIRATGQEHGDVCDPACVEAALAGCDGVLHLAAVSRVVWGERDPEKCWATNVGGLTHVLNAARKQAHPPWVMFASSREVYGQPPVLPADEDTALDPVNVYARSKVEGERRVLEARNQGLRTAIVRLSNVYGRTFDHVDRVVPAFARAAVAGARLRVDGWEHTFDFTHVDDVCRGLVAMAELLDRTDALLPAIQLVSGVPTTLGQLAELAIELARSSSDVVCAPPRTFDVARFYGSPQRAGACLAWQPQIPLREGLAKLIADLQAEALPNQSLNVISV